MSKISARAGAWVAPAPSEFTEPPRSEFIEARSMLEEVMRSMREWPEDTLAQSLDWYAGWYEEKTARARRLKAWAASHAGSPIGDTPDRLVSQVDDEAQVRQEGFEERWEAEWAAWWEQAQEQLHADITPRTCAPPKTRL